MACSSGYSVTDHLQAELQQAFREKGLDLDAGDNTMTGITICEYWRFLLSKQSFLEVILVLAVFLLLIWVMYLVLGSLLIEGARKVGPFG